MISLLQLILIIFLVILVKLVLAIHHMMSQVIQYNQGIEVLMQTNGSVNHSQVQMKFFFQNLMMIKIGLLQLMLLVVQVPSLILKVVHMFQYQFLVEYVHHQHQVSIQLLYLEYHLSHNGFGHLVMEDMFPLTSYPISLFLTKI